MFESLANAGVTRESVPRDPAEAGSGDEGGEDQMIEDLMMDEGIGGDDDDWGDGNGDEAFDGAAGGGGGGAWGGDQYRAAEERAEAAKREKMELLMKLQRLASSGNEVRVDLSMATHIDDLRMEHMRITNDSQVRDSIRMQRKMLLLTVNVLQWGNGRYDPLGIDLDGWSQNVCGSLDEYDPIFTALHEKYGGPGGGLPPELQLMLALGGSALMCHMSNSMAKASLAGLKAPKAQPAPPAARASRSAAPSAPAAGGGKMAPPPTAGILGGLFRRPAQQQPPPLEAAPAAGEEAAPAAAPGGEESERGAGAGYETAGAAAPGASVGEIEEPAFVEVPPGGGEGAEGEGGADEDGEGVRMLSLPEGKTKKRAAGGRKKSSNTGAQPLAV